MADRYRVPCVRFHVSLNTMGRGVIIFLLTFIAGDNRKTISVVAVLPIAAQGLRKVDWIFHKKPAEGGEVR